MAARSDTRSDSPSGRRYAGGIYAVAAIILVALLLRLGAGWWWQSRLPAGSRFGFADSESYWQLAQTIYRGEPYQFANEDAKIFRTPGFPLVLSSVMFLTRNDNPSVYWARGLTAILGTLSVGGVMLLARQLFDGRAATIAGLLAACYPESISLGMLVLSESAFCPWMLLHLSAWIASLQQSHGKRAIGWALLGGAASGAAVLVRPSWLLFLPFASACGWLIAPPRTRHLKLFSVMTAAMIVVLLPWWIRNYQVAGSFVPTTLQVGASLYDGISPTATGASNMEFAPRHVEMLRERDRTTPDNSGKTFEQRLDQWLHAESVAWAQSHPAEVARLAGVKLMRIWSPWPNDRGFSNLRVAIISAATFLPMMLCIAVGIRKTWHRGWSYQLCAVPAVYFTLLHMVFVGSIRYRQPAMLSLIVLAAGVISTWIRPNASDDTNSHSNSNSNPNTGNGNDRASRD